MNAAPPFDRTDLPHHTRVLGTPVAATYAAVTDVARWPEWVPDVLDPVIAKGSDQFLFRARKAGRIEHHEGQVILRGPTHTFALEAGGARLWFRTRPSSTGTKVDLVLEPRAEPAWRRFGNQRRRARREQWVVEVLDALASHLDEAAREGERPPHHP